MSTGSLLPLVRGYLESAGCKILHQENECLVADKLLFGQDRDTWVVWTVPPEQETGKYESTLRASISATRPNYPDAKAYVIARSRGGFSREFQQTLSDDRIRLLVPIWFFDAAFKVEEAPKAASAIADIRSLDILQTRVPQPFKADPLDGESAEGVDLLDSLLDELTKDTKPTVRIVVGRAGIGKSILFRALFARLYDGFLRAKREQASGRRPIPLLPEHLKGAFGMRTELLVDNFLRTDVASPVPRETFEWLLANGFTTWLLDGLDELYAGDPYFFEYLSDLLTRKNSRAQITVCCRDSLLTTSDAFAEFQDLCAGSSALKIYRLLDWERPWKRRYAWIELERRAPKAGEQDTQQVGSFLSILDGSATLRLLSGLPFYCAVLLQQFREGNIQEFADDVAMLNYVIDQMLKREIDKGLLDLRLFVPNGIQDWLELIAVSYVEGSRYADIDRNEAMEYGRLVLREGVDQTTQNHILTSLLQFPLFCAGTESGRIKFSHDLIAEVLAARGYLQRLRQEPADVGHRLSRVDLDNPTLLRFIASKMTQKEEDAVIKALQGGALKQQAFAVMLTLLMLARPERDLLKRVGANFEGRDLSGVRFAKRDLGGLSFRGSDLSSALFQGCDLRGAQFEGAFCNRTHFEGGNSLEDAQFGDLSRLQSVFLGRKLLEERPQLREWVAKVTGHAPVLTEPCPTAMQMRHMFGKFITPLGEAKRDDLKRDALAGGRRYGGAASTEECIEGAVRHGYLAGPDLRDRFRRAEGDKYAELVRFVRDGAVGDGIGRMVAHLCRRRGCMHQLRS